MIPLLVSAAVGLVVSIFGTPWVIRVMERRRIGQFVQEELANHAHKQGVPTMGGLVFVSATVIGYLLSHVRVSSGGVQFTQMRAGGLLCVLALVGMAVVGFMDDWIKYTRKRSLGLSKSAKFGGQLVVAVLFAIGATQAGVVTQISFVRPLGIDLGVLFVVWVLLMMTGFANAVNLADGMDGLA
ncbi:MAG TPA: phospho-N-acetylmuramoyl-pentapeptide-transferase, partial [Acidimicrobiia bacterium]|nr:phospho-N-acetylmuramoyl-pentapeptide-transferase [Acidimicrobiia bacterium]